MFNLIFRSALKTLGWAKSPSKTMGSELLPRWYYFFFALVELGGVFKYLFKVPAMVQPHTTSKISQVCCIAQLLVFQQCEIMCYQFSDLCNLSTFGFRGEALASLCAVSRWGKGSFSFIFFLPFQAHYCEQESRRSGGNFLFFLNRWRGHCEEIPGFKGLPSI